MIGNLGSAGLCSQDFDKKKIEDANNSTNFWACTVPKRDESDHDMPLELVIVPQAFQLVLVKSFFTLFLSMLLPLLLALLPKD